MRVLLVLASAMVFFDVAFYAAIAPLLPDYVDDLDLSKAQAGILTASYAVGTLAASLPAGFAASRFGPRRTVIAGLFVLGVSSLIFGLAQNILLLDSARFVQGISGALIWSGSLTWLIMATPEENRGTVIGTALGMAVAGALLGPALGAAAASVGTGLIFGLVLVVSLGLAYAASRIEDVTPPEHQTLREVWETMTTRPVIDTYVFISAPSLMFGAFEVLAPLRIDSFGGGHGVIAAGFIAGAAAEAALAPFAGRLSDRVGRRLPYVVGLGICAVSMLGIALVESLGGILVALIVASVGAGLCYAPAVTMLSDVAESTGLHQGFAAGLSNMAWASGQMLGGIVGGAVASLTGDTGPSVVIAAVLVAAVLYALRTLPAGAKPPVVEVES